jgi:hypothetical protein
MRWAILGTGEVSAAFVRGLAQVSGARATIVASREVARARAFAAPLGIPAATGAPHRLSAGFPPMRPLDGALRPMEDWRRTHRPGLLDRLSRDIIDRLHQH